MIVYDCDGRPLACRACHRVDGQLTVYPSGVYCQDHPPWRAPFQSCLAHPGEIEPCPICRSYIAAGL